MRFVDDNDYGSDGDDDDDVSTPKQPGEIPGVVVFNEDRERNSSSQEIEQVSELGVLRRDGEANRQDERMKA